MQAVRAERGLWSPPTRRLGVAVTRGLLLDLLATGDVDRVDEAMGAFIDLYEAGLTHTDRM